MSFVLPDLPYATDGFGRTLSAESFSFHHGKHHKAYVDKTNAALAEHGLEGKALTEVVAWSKDNNKGLFNNSAQIWNHSFFWQCLSPAGGAPSGELADRLTADFGGVDAFKSQLADKAVGHFGSGWAWLVLDGDTLKLADYHDADTPIVHGVKPLLTIDVWEHAYYIDHRNARPDYVKAILDNVVNWDFVASNLDGKGADRADQAG